MCRVNKVSHKNMASSPRSNKMDDLVLLTKRQSLVHRKLIPAASAVDVATRTHDLGNLSRETRPLGINARNI